MLLARSDERGTVMPFSRRDAFKLGGLGALGVAGLAIPFGNMVSAKDPSQLPKGRARSVWGSLRLAGEPFQRLKVLQKTGHDDNPRRNGRRSTTTTRASAAGTISVHPRWSPTC